MRCKSLKQFFIIPQFRSISFFLDNQSDLILFVVKITVPIFRTHVTTLNEFSRNRKLKSRKSWQLDMVATAVRLRSWPEDLISRPMQQLFTPKKRNTFIDQTTETFWYFSMAFSTLSVTAAPQRCRINLWTPLINSSLWLQQKKEELL